MATSELNKQINSLLEEDRGGVMFADTPGFCKSATLEEVKGQDYKLTPGIYVGTEAEEDDWKPFEEKMEKLIKNLSGQFK